MLRRRRLLEQDIFFPWERRGGLRRRLRVHRLRRMLIVAGFLGLLVTIAVRERRRAGVRQTRATLLDTRQAVDAYLADHQGGCPPSLSDLAKYAGSQQVPRDAWGRPLRLICPGRREGSRYELMSDGPDGLPGGLDRIE